MLKMSVAGNPSELYQFMSDFKSQPHYGVEIESKEYTPPEFKEQKITATVNFTPKVRKPLMVTMETEEGKEVQIHFLDSIMVELHPGVTFISGKVFDIFG